MVLQGLLWMLRLWLTSTAGIATERQTERIQSNSALLVETPTVDIRGSFILQQQPFLLSLCVAVHSVVLVKIVLHAIILVVAIIVINFNSVVFI